MNEHTVLTDALLAAGALIIFFSGLFYGLYRVVVWARQRRKRAYVVGAVLSPYLGLGNVADPDFRIVQEAKRLKNREDDGPGDPPESEDERLTVQASRSAEPVVVPTAAKQRRGWSLSGPRAKRPVAFQRQPCRLAQGNSFVPARGDRSASFSKRAFLGRSHAYAGNRRGIRECRGRRQPGPSRCAICRRFAIR